jgi:hypothetical protein
MVSGFVSRLGFVWTSARRRVWLVVQGIWAIASNASQLREWLPDAMKQYLPSIPHWPWWVWLGGAAVILFLAVIEGAYRATESATRSAQDAQSQLKNVQQGYVSAIDWIDLRDRFRNLRGFKINAVLTAQQGTSAETWSLESHSEPHLRAFELTCALAGQTLARSKIWKEIPDTVRNTSKARDRWLEYVRAKDGMPNVTTGSIKRPDGAMDHCTAYRFADLPLSSKRLCDECAVSERLD